MTLKTSTTTKEFYNRTRRLGLCAATDWVPCHRRRWPHVMGVCNLRAGHTGAHIEQSWGLVRAEWIKDCGPIPDTKWCTHD